jgi:hypothetical protein
MGPRPRPAFPEEAHRCFASGCRRSRPRSKLADALGAVNRSFWPCPLVPSLRRRPRVSCRDLGDASRSNEVVGRKESPDPLKRTVGSNRQEGVPRVEASRRSPPPFSAAYGQGQVAMRPAPEARLPTSASSAAIRMSVAFRMTHLLPVVRRARDGGGRMSRQRAPSLTSATSPPSTLGAVLPLSKRND